MIKSIPLTNFKLPTPRAAKNIIKAANLKRCRSQDFTNKPSDPFQNE